jgi:hypothetical protein
MWLTKTCVHQRSTSVKNAIGGNTPTWATATSDIPCAIWPAGSAMARTFLRRDLVGDHVIVAGSDLSVVSRDRFTVSGESGYFVVNGFEKFQTDTIGATIVYAIDVTKRTV